MIVNMNLLHFVGYFATGLAFCFMVLSLACGLYYLAELVEEYTVYTKKVIKSMTIFVVALHVLLCIFDRLPVLNLLFSIFCHGVYSLNLATFPFIRLTSLPFLSSCVLVFVDHFIWFKYFTRHYRPFMDIASFFGVCVWLIPFTYFISLSANDNALPMMTDPNAESVPNQQKTGLFKSMLGFLGRSSDQPLMPSVTSQAQPVASSPPMRVPTPMAAYDAPMSHHQAPVQQQQQQHDALGRPMTPSYVTASNSNTINSHHTAYASQHTSMAYPTHEPLPQQPHETMIPPASVVSSYAGRHPYASTAQLQNRKAL